jgi:heme oxygenase
LSLRLRDATATLHRQAERAGIMPMLLQGRLPLAGYLALLVQLERLYAALERGLDADGAPPVPAALRRRTALRDDLAVWHARAGEVDVTLTVAPLAVTRRYARRLAWLAGCDPVRLAAHAYVRYLGDLAGGQALRRAVGRAYGLADAGLRFYDFGPADAAAALARDLRAMLDALPASRADAVAAEACWAFEAHIAMFQGLGQALGQTGCPTVGTDPAVNPR